MTVLYAEHVKEPGGALSSFTLYSCTIPATTTSSGSVAQMGNSYQGLINRNNQPTNQLLELVF